MKEKKETSRLDFCWKEGRIPRRCFCASAAKKPTNKLLWKNIRISSEKRAAAQQHSSTAAAANLFIEDQVADARCCKRWEMMWEQDRRTEAAALPFLLLVLGLLLLLFLGLDETKRREKTSQSKNRRRVEHWPKYATWITPIIAARSNFTFDPGKKIRWPPMKETNIHNISRRAQWQWLEIFVW